MKGHYCIRRDLEFFSFESFEDWFNKNQSLLTPRFREEKIKSSYLEDFKNSQSLLKSFNIDGYSELVPHIFVEGQEDTETGVSFGIAYVRFALKIGEHILLPYKPKNHETGYRFTLRGGKYLYSFESSLVQPNKVGTASRAKLQAWLDYLLTLEEEKSSLIQVQESARQAFLKKLEPYEDFIKWGEDRTSGSIERDGIKYYFELTDGSFLQQIKVSSTPQAIESFLRRIGE